MADNTTRARLPYSNKDYTSLREELLTRIPSCTPDWTDFNASDLGIVLLDLFCGIGDMLAYYLDAQAVESYLPTARQRPNAANLLDLIAYRLMSPVPATVTLTFTLPEAELTDVTIPGGTVCKATLDDGDVSFETVADLVIAAGDVSGTVGARQGTRVTDTFTAVGGQWQSVALTELNVGYGTVRVTVNGVAWEEQTYLYDSDADSQHFYVKTDGTETTRVYFGDGVYGAMPSAGQAVVVSYLKTDGQSGNLAPNLITAVVSVLTHGGQPLTVAVTNAGRSTGGDDHETLAHARLLAPKVLKAMWKAVTVDDYQALTLTVPGVAKAQVLDTNTVPTMRRYYFVRMVVAPNGGGLPSAQLKADVKAFLDGRKTLTTYVEVVDPSYRTVDVTAVLYLYPGESPDNAQSAAQAAVEAYFDFATRAFGQSVFLSDLYAILDRIPGVNHVTLRAPTADVVLEPDEIATLGTLTLTTLWGTA